jgi:Tfp pilus assembly protein PilZ
MSEQPLSYRHHFYDPQALVRSYLPTFPGGGFFLRTEEPFSLWTRFLLTFDLPPDGEALTCLVEVIWVNKGQPDTIQGMGARIVKMDPRAQARLEVFLRTWARKEELFDGRFFRISPLGGAGTKGRAGPPDGGPGDESPSPGLEEKSGATPRS